MITGENQPFFPCLEGVKKMYGNRFPVEAEVPILMIIGLALGHLIFAAGVGYFIRKKKKKDCYMPMLGYIVCSLISFYFWLSTLFGWKRNVDVVMLSEYNSLSIAFFGVFWMLGIFLLIVLIAMLCKEKSE